MTSEQTPLEDLIHGRTSQTRVRQLLVDLVRLPSPQTESFEAEPLLSDFIRQAVEPRLRELGMSNIHYDSMGNLISKHGAGTSSRSLMFVGHAMNQPAGAMKDPYAGRVVDGAAFGLTGDAVLGRGASEQKGNLAAMLHAIEVALAIRPSLHGSLVFVCCLSGESGTHDAIRSVMESGDVRAEMAVLGGAGLEISLGNRGRLDVAVTVRGEACHSSRPWDGANAIVGAIECIRRIAAQVPLGGEDSKLGRRTLTVNHIASSPDSTHTVQDRCVFRLDRRLLPGEDPLRAFDEIADAARTTEEEFRDPLSGGAFAIDVQQGPYMYPSLVDANSPVVHALRRASGAMLGKPAETVIATNANDQGYLNHVGIPTVNYGPGEARFAHTDTDIVAVERATDAAKVLAFLILDSLG